MAPNGHQITDPLLIIPMDRLTPTAVLFLTQCQPPVLLSRFNTIVFCMEEYAYIYVLSTLCTKRIKFFVTVI